MPKMAKHAPGEARKRLRYCPGGLKMKPRGAKTGPTEARKHQKGNRSVFVAFFRASSAPQGRPRAPQEGPKSTQERPRAPKRAPRGSQEGPKSVPRGSQEGPKSSPRGKPRFYEKPTFSYRKAYDFQGSGRPGRPQKSTRN